MTASQLTVPPAVCTVLLLAESEAERERWLQVLGELQRLLLDTRPRPRPVYTLKEAYDNGLPLLPHALCAAIIGEPRGSGEEPGLVGRVPAGHCLVPAGSLRPQAADSPHYVREPPPGVAVWAARSQGLRFRLLPLLFSVPQSFCFFSKHLK